MDGGWFIAVFHFRQYILLCIVGFVFIRHRSDWHRVTLLMDGKHLEIVQCRAFQKVKLFCVKRQGFEIKDKFPEPSILVGVALLIQRDAVASNNGIRLPFRLQITLPGNPKPPIWWILISGI